MYPRRNRSLHALAGVAAFAFLFSSGCSRGPSAPEAGLNSITADRLLAQTRTLAADEFEGRAPGGAGEQRTIQYLEAQLREFGLEPGNPDGTYLQKVPLVGITADPAMTLTITQRGRTERLRFGDDFVAWTKRVTDSVSAAGEIVFVGYGVTAPEFNWDDFKGADLRGKVLLFLVNDPPVENEPIFGGQAMTYYGRWTYKFEKAAQLGAAAALIIHETGPAGYPWEVVRGSWSGEQFDLITPDRNMGRAAVEGWITRAQAERLLRRAGKDLEALKRVAATREFRPVPLGLRAEITVRNTLRTVDSHNVIARITGSDPELRSQYVVYTAHWDHLGVAAEGSGDRIFNGAKDNAAGTAAVLEIARAFRQLRVPPRRSLLFLFVTAEEQGLLGSRYYAEHPLYPLPQTAAVINLDAPNVLGPTRDLVVIGMGNSTLDDVAQQIASRLGRTLKPDPEPEKGFFYRSDHFSFARFGVPAFYADEGIEFLGKPEGWGMEMRQKYTAEDYHKPSDEVKDYLDLRGLAEDSRFFFLMGYTVANDPRLPEWKPGTEFKAIREQSLRPASR
ncbi:MAG: M20/M25/M40 family metallo-hydrolase [Acidobacteriia bacterium]|jgi:Zn-dependent M28 family amino/carboxypeptidase|nr:M20/M25/M40 family metallo-hydrolase [Terriglobia bacterium]